MDESALKELIASLGDQISSIGWWMYFWTSLVIVGCAGELFFVIHAYLDERKIWFKATTRGAIAFPEKPSLWVLILEVTSVALVVVGIAGELLVDWKSDDLQTRLRSANGSLVLKLEKSAGEAKDSAKAAGISATEAGKVGDAAKKKADAVGVEANSFDERIVSANKTATEAESHLAAALERTARLEAQLSWRTVTPEQSATVAAYLKPSFFNPNINFRGLKISFEYNQGDLEASEYAEDLGKALRVALNGFDVEIGEPQGMIVMGFTGPPITGLILQVNRANDERAAVLLRALGAAGIVAVGELKSTPEGTLTLFVGVRPRPSAAKQ